MNEIGFSDTRDLGPEAREDLALAISTIINENRNLQNIGLQKFSNDANHGTMLLEAIDT